MNQALLYCGVDLVDINYISQKYAGAVPTIKLIEESGEAERIIRKGVVWRLPKIYLKLSKYRLTGRVHTVY